MRKILIVMLTLCCFVSSFAQKGKGQNEEKFQKIHTINDAVLSGDPASGQMIDDFVARYGMTSDILTIQAMKEERMGNIAGAKQKLDQAIATCSGNEVIDLSTLYCFRMDYCEDYGEKLVYAELSLKANQKNLQTILKRAEIYQILEKNDNAIKDLKKAVKVSNGAPYVRTELARMYIIAGDEKKGVKELDNILADYPNSAEARELRAIANFYGGRIEPFVDDYLYYLQLSNDLNMRYVNAVADTAYAYILDYADQIMSSVIDPEDIAYWNYFEGNVKMATERDIEGGMRNLERALSITKDTGELRCRILTLQLLYYETHRQFDKELEAIREIERIVERDGEKPAAWVVSTKSTLLRREKRYGEVAECLNSLIADYREDSAMTAYYYYLRADLNLDKLNNPDGALADIDSALAYNPDKLPYIYKRARICEKYFKHGDYVGKIKSDCERILEIDTVESADSYRHFALAMLGRRAEAEGWLQRIVDKFGKNQRTRSIINYNGACMYALMNDVYNATRLLMDAMENGGVSCEQLRDDADFDNIRETAEFRSILKIQCSDE